MGASLGFFGRVRPTFPWARAPGVVRRPGVGPPCLGRVSGANRAGAPRLCQAAGQSTRSPADSEWGLQVKPGRLGMGQSSPADSECQWGGSQ